MTLTLQRSTRIKPSEGPVLLVVLDGVGLGTKDEFDAVARGRTPVLDHMLATVPWCRLKAHGTAVGLPSDSDMGNSEVGHNALGAGRVFDQGAKLVNRAIADGSLFAGEVWGRVVGRCVDGGGALHLIGLLSDGNVHSHQDQLHAMIEAADRAGVSTLYVHTLLDGRDTPEASALEYVDPLEALLAKIDARDDRRYRIASGGGRMITTMDRYNADWRIVERGWNTHVHGDGRRFRTAREAIETYRAEEPGLIDQWLPPFVVGDDAGPAGPVRDGDVVVFFNFRGDRAIEISRAFEEGDEFDEFDRGRRPDVLYAGMTLYDGDLRIPKTYLVTPPAIDRTISAYLAEAGVTQYALSETQKFGHVTYFWNGNRGGKFDDATETYEEIKSDLVPFDQRPWMKAAEITDRILEVLAGGEHRFCRINYPNGDMVGHTGDFQATIIAVETVDLCLARLWKAADRARATLVVLADHGNSDDMVERDKDGTPKYDDDGNPRRRTSHSLNAVPCIVYRADGVAVTLRDDLDTPGLANVAATLLELLGYEPPAGYEPSLLK